MARTKEKKQQTRLEVVLKGFHAQVVRLHDFLMGPGKEFALYACERGIPSIVDGLKTSQRKVIFGMLNNGYGNTERRLDVLAPQLVSVSAYQHGSLDGVVVGLAQTFAGSNNINLLDPKGQFGDRMTKEAAAARYIYAKLSKAVREIFKKEDDLILEHLDDDGIPIEPKYYYPILPMVLVNGAEGMGTGFASNILAYNPIDIKQYILNRLKNKKQNVSLTPWYRHYNGTVERIEETGQVVITGKIEKLDSTTLKITEFPIGTFQDDAKKTIIELKRDGFVKGYKDYSDANHLEFELDVPRTTGYLDESELLKKFKLIKRDTENFTVWLPHGKLMKFESAEDLCDYFIKFRVEIYEKRRLALIAENSKQLNWLNEKLRWIKYYIEHSKEIAGKNDQALHDLLKTLKFSDDHTDILLNIPIRHLTKEQIEKLKKDIETVEAEIKFLKSTTKEAMYTKELEELDIEKLMA
jgi:DNA topoisomerase-2